MRVETNGFFEPLFRSCEKSQSAARGVVYSLSVDLPVRMRSWKIGMWLHLSDLQRGGRLMSPHDSD